MTADWKALCAELADALHNAIRVIHYEDGTLHISTAEPVLERARAALAQPEPEGPTLQWTDNLPPSEECRYDHCTAETPFGRFLISWKSWKQYDSPTVDETPWGDWYESFSSVDKAKAACQQGLNERLARWGRPALQPADGEVAELVEWLLEEAVQAADADQPRAAGMLTWTAQVIGEQGDLLECLAPQPMPVRKQPWEQEGWCDGSGRCWFGWTAEAGLPPDALWTYCRPSERDTATVSLPAHALPVPTSDQH